MSANDNFVMLVRLPVEPFDRWPRIGRIRELIGLTAHLLLCVLVNKQGDELQFAFPRSLPAAEKLKLLDRFAIVVSSSDAWTDQPPEAQHPADASWPRAWYYDSSQSPQSQVRAWMRRRLWALSWPLPEPAQYPASHR
jgi:hypothetical protein